MYEWIELDRGIWIVDKFPVGGIAVNAPVCVNWNHFDAIDVTVLTGGQDHTERCTHHHEGLLRAAIHGPTEHNRWSGGKHIEPE